jgi:hypothetical protein
MPEQGPESSEPTLIDPRDVLKGASPEKIDEYQSALLHEIAYPDPEFTPEQYTNEKVMEGLSEKYPHAFVEHMTKDGRRYIVTRSNDINDYPDAPNITNYSGSYYGDGDNGDNTDYCTLAFSYRGVTQINQRQFADGSYRPRSIMNYDLTPIINSEQEKVSGYNVDQQNRRVAIKLGTTEGYSDVTVTSYEHMPYAGDLSRATIISEKLSAYLKEKEDEFKNYVEPKAPSASDILSRL